MIIQGTTLSASRIGLGTHSLHRLMSASARQRLLAAAYESGVSYFDTAPSYGSGLAERELGRFLRDKRSKVVVTTKFGIPTGRLGARIPGWNLVAMGGRLARRVLSKHSGAGTRRDFSAQEARASVEGSLRALGTDHIDVLYLHEPSLGLLGEPESLAPALEELQTSGKVRYFGLSGQAAACTEIGRHHPRLAGLLQIEVPAAADGLPDKLSAAAAVRFWELAPGPVPAGRLGAILERLLAQDPQSVTLLSTNSEGSLREAVAILDKFDSRMSRSATSYLV